MEMLKTLKEERVGGLILRLLQTKDEYIGIIRGGKDIPEIHGDDPNQILAKLRAEVGKASPSYFGYDGARSRFLEMFADGFTGDSFHRKEHDYKVSASEYLLSNLPLERANLAEANDCEAAARAFAKTNLLSPFERARTREVLKGKDGAAFIQASAAVANGDLKCFPEIERIFKPHGAPSWPAATYLPFLWRPDTQMFLKPAVTKDYADRVGDPFARSYQARLLGTVYDDLLSLAFDTREHLRDLAPKDNIDIQSFIWIIGAYGEADAEKLIARTS